MDEWKLIESAPKDGTQMLLANYPDDGGIWGIRQGFYEAKRWYDIDGEMLDSPDVWMPLPPAPAR